MRRLGAYMLTITLGVGALVAINSYRASAVRSVESEARALLGADLRLTTNRAFPDSVLAVVDSFVAAERGRRSLVVSTLTVTFAANGRARLSQLNAVDGTYPFYGAPGTNPAGRWGEWGDDRVIGEPKLLQDLGIGAGDSLRVGRRWLEVAAAVTDLPPEFNFQSEIGPRAYLSRAALDSAGVLAFGSLARYHVYVAVPDTRVLAGFLERHRQSFTRAQVRAETAEEQAEQLGQALDALTRFLGLVGLTALLLGGLGVGSAVHVFVRERRDTIAVLRCVGATRGAAFGAYLLQAVALGLAGSALGVLLGVAIQFALPLVLRDVIPFDVTLRLEWGIIGTGLLLGGWVAFVFALLPLLGVRTITPLRALRQDVEGGGAWWRDPWHWAVLALLLLTIAALSTWQTAHLLTGLAFTAALLAGLLVLWLSAALMVRLTRRWFPRRARYETRQGIRNLFRPQNQTTIVTMAVGFGVFLLSALLVVQSNLVGWLDVEDTQAQPNLVAFDIQSDQVADVRGRITAATDRALELTPIIPARIAAIRGVPAESLLALPRNRGVEPWAVRREYRHTSRAGLGDAERLVEGEWWDARPAPDGVARVSVERDVARSLDVKIGDRITWDVQGVRIESQVTSVREVDWARFDTNFFFIFEPGALDDAPQTYVALARVDSAAARATLQRDIVTHNPNVTVIDLAQLTETLAGIVSRTALAIRFMALFSVFGGTVVLVAALAAGRFARVRETALLRTLGARDRQVHRIMLTEYAALGALAALTGVLLGALAGWLMVRFLFDLEFQLPVGQLALVAAAVIALSLLIGLLLGRDALRRPPLATLREAAG